MKNKHRLAALCLPLLLLAGCGGSISGGSGLGSMPIVTPEATTTTAPAVSATTTETFSTSATDASTSLAPLTTTTITTTTTTQSVTTTTTTAAAVPTPQNELIYSLIQMDSAEIIRQMKGVFEIERDQIGEMVYIYNDSVFPQTRFYYRATMAPWAGDTEDDSVLLPYMRKDLSSRPQVTQKINTYAGGLTCHGLTCGSRYTEAGNALKGMKASYGDAGEYFCGAPSSAAFYERKNELLTTIHYDLTDKYGNYFGYMGEKLTDAYLREKNPVLYVLTVEQAPSKAPQFTSVTASSTLGNIGDHSYSAKNVTDGRLDTCWCEGVDGPGYGESITFTASTPQPVNYIQIFGGLCTNDELYYKNNRPWDVMIEFDDGSGLCLTLPDDFSTIQSGDRTWCCTSGTAVWTKSVKITILTVHSGYAYDDTCISEIKFPALDYSYLP